MTLLNGGLKKKDSILKLNSKEKGRWMMPNSTRAQIPSRKQSSEATLNLHKTYLFLKCDLVNMKVENWKGGS